MTLPCKPRLSDVARQVPGAIRLLALGCTLATLTGLSGCQFAPKLSAPRWPWSKQDGQPLPDRILPVWTDTVLHQPNQPGVRGFGGRVYFYTKDDSDPVEIDGGLAVYVFDADDENPQSQQPLRKFAFTADQFVSHMSRTSLGPSYSIWLPWGEVGGPPKRLSLIARFEGREGGTVISEPTIKLLPGVPAKPAGSSNDLAAKRSNSAFQLAGHPTPVGQEPTSTPLATSPESSARSRAIGTIDLPPSFQRHLRSDRQPLPTAPAAGPSPPAVPGTSGTSQEPTPVLEAPLEASPVTTEVFDYRSRTQPRSQPSTPGLTDKTNIRDGRWIKTPSRRDP